MSGSKAPEEPVVDLARLNAWPGLADVPGDGPVESLEPLKGGAQNLLFTMRRADGTELVLRRPGRHAGEEAAKPFERESACCARWPARPSRIRGCTRAPWTSA
ncbi:hypothetical protein [Actinomadura sp. CNU-125]|uniref:hypothetical protein n=1 Tax=Actinomadura sp. CNU-125 TaxID=1904961 RepID=UPI000A4CBEB8|nr:hypothetical protein [Actinomadura sp. CNU-125]